MTQRDRRHVRQAIAQARFADPAEMRYRALLAMLPAAAILLAAMLMSRLIVG